MLVKIKHPIVNGNESGFAFVDHENLTNEHEVVSIENIDTDTALDLALKSIIKATLVINTLPAKHQELAKLAIFNHFNFASLDSREAVEVTETAPAVIASSKTAKAVSAAPAKTDGPSEIPDPGTGWAKD